MPGDALYGLKRFTEQVDLWAADSGMRPDILYHLALNRVAELDILSGRGDLLSDADLSDLTESMQSNFFASYLQYTQSMFSVMIYIF